MIKNIIFDIGNVLATFSWESHIRKFGFSEDIYERVVDATVKSPIWKEYDRGVWTQEEILQGFIANDPAVEPEIRIVNEDLSTMVTKRDYAIPWVKSLKAAGYKVYYLSNFAGKAERECWEALGFTEDMDGGIFSFREKLIKPDPAIYRLLLERYGLTAEESVFLDDTKENITAAQALGFHAFVFENQQQAIGEMEKLGVKTAAAE